MRKTIVGVLLMALPITLLAAFSQDKGKPSKKTEKTKLGPTLVVDCPQPNMPYSPNLRASGTTPGSAATVVGYVLDSENVYPGSTDQDPMMSNSFVWKVNFSGLPVGPAIFRVEAWEDIEDITTKDVPFTVDEKGPDDCSHGKDKKPPPPQVVGRRKPSDVLLTIEWVRITEEKIVVRGFVSPITKSLYGLLIKEKPSPKVYRGETKKLGPFYKVEFARPPMNGRYLVAIRTFCGNGKAQKLIELK